MESGCIKGNVVGFDKNCKKNVLRSQKKFIYIIKLYRGNIHLAATKSKSDTASVD